MLFLDELNAVFPDARFVMTHRDPDRCHPVGGRLYADIIGGFTDHIDRGYIGRLNVEHWSLGMQRALQFRDGGADKRFYDIDFRAMQADPDRRGSRAVCLAGRAGQRRIREPDA